MPGETGMASTAGCNPEERLPECHQHPTDRNARSACKRSVYSDGGVLNVATMPAVLLQQDWHEESRTHRQTNANLQDCLCSSRRLRDDRCIEPYVSARAKARFLNDPNRKLEHCQEDRAVA